MYSFPCCQYAEFNGLSSVIDLPERTYCTIDRIHFVEASIHGASAGKGSNIPSELDLKSGT